MSASPLPPLTGSSSSSRLSYNSHDPGGRHRDSTRSGSETERESHHSTSYSSDDQSLTPPSTAAQPPRPKTSTAPSSPTKAHHSGRSRVFSPGASTNNKPIRKRVSVTDSERESEREDENDVTVAALAAVASLRRSPTSTSIGRRSRQPLPREFRDRDGRVSFHRPRHVPMFLMTCVYLAEFHSTYYSTPTCIPRSTYHCYTRISFT